MYEDDFTFLTLSANICLVDRYNIYKNKYIFLSTVSLILVDDLSSSVAWKGKKASLFYSLVIVKSIYA